MIGLKKNCWKSWRNKRDTPASIQAFRRHELLKSARKRGAASPGRWIWPPRPRRPLQECPGALQAPGRPGGVGTHPGINLFLCWKGLRTPLMQLLKNSPPPPIRWYQKGHNMVQTSKGKQWCPEYYDSEAPHPEGRPTRPAPGWGWAKPWPRWTGTLATTTVFSEERGMTAWRRASEHTWMVPSGTAWGSRRVRAPSCRGPCITCC